MCLKKKKKPLTQRLHCMCEVKYGSMIDMSQRWCTSHDSKRQQTHGSSYGLDRFLPVPF